MIPEAHGAKPVPAGLKAKDDRPHGVPKSGARSAWVVTRNEVHLLSPKGEVNVFDDGVVAVHVPVACKTCGLVQVLRLDEAGADAEERQMGPEVDTFYGNTYFCSGCESELSVECMLWEYPPAALHLDGFEEHDAARVVALPGVDSFFDDLRSATPFSWKLRRDLEEANDLLASIDGAAPNLAAGIRAMAQAIGRSVAFFGSYAEGYSLKLDEIERVVATHGREAVVVDKMERLRGEANRDKARRIAQLCSLVIIHDEVPSGHLNEVEMTKDLGRPVVILQAGPHLSTRMLAGGNFDARNIHIVPVNGKLSEAVKTALDWGRVYLTERENKVQASGED